MKSLVNNLAFSALTLLAFSAQAQQSSNEVTCRAQAKEIATQTYSSCMTEARNSQIDDIRREYQQQLEELKAKYDKELKKVGGKAPEEMSSDERAAAAAAAGEVSSFQPEKTGLNKSKPAKTVTKGKIKAKGKIAKSVPKSLPAKATKGIAKTLPTREESRVPALPAREVRVETPVVVTDIAPVAPGFEEDLPSQNDAQGDLQIQLTPASGATVANPDEFY